MSTEDENNYSDKLIKFVNEKITTDDRLINLDTLVFFHHLTESNKWFATIVEKQNGQFVITDHRNINIEELNECNKKFSEMITHLITNSKLLSNESIGLTNFKSIVINPKQNNLNKDLIECIYKYMKALKENKPFKGTSKFFTIPFRIPNIFGGGKRMTLVKRRGTKKQKTQKSKSKKH